MKGRIVSWHWHQRLPIQSGLPEAVPMSQYPVVYSVLLFKHLNDDLFFVLSILLSYILYSLVFLQQSLYALFYISSLSKKKSGINCVIIMMFFHINLNISNWKIIFFQTDSVFIRSWLCIFWDISFLIKLICNDLCQE